MLKAATLTVSIVAMSALFALDASALPVTPFKQQPAAEGLTTLVRDGCGRGMRFSRRLQECVERDGDRRDRRHYNDDDDAGAAAVGTILGIIGSAASDGGGHHRNNQQGQQHQQRQGQGQRGQRGQRGGQQQQPGADGQED